MAAATEKGRGPWRPSVRIELDRYRELNAHVLEVAPHWLPESLTEGFASGRISSPTLRSGRSFSRFFAASTGRGLRPVGSRWPGCRFGCGSGHDDEDSRRECYF